MLWDIKKDSEYFIEKYWKVKNTIGGWPPISYRIFHILWMNFSFSGKKFILIQ